MKPLKYPKTWHCPESKPDAHGNDRILNGLEHFLGKEVMVSCKLDGECTGMTNKICHARSLDSKDHVSRHYIKQIHGNIARLILDEWEIFGENLQAKHAIYYTNLPTYFFVFGVYNDKNICLSWDQTMEFCKELGLTTVPILYRGVWDENRIRSCYTGRTIIDGRDCGEQEGYVVRNSHSFHYSDFADNVYKFVRQNHVAGDTEHWSKTGYKPNKLKE